MVQPTPRIEAVAHAVGQNDARRALRPARKQRAEVAPFGPAGGQAEHVGFEAGQLHVAVRPLVAGPKLDSTERLLGLAGTPSLFARTGLRGLCVVAEWHARHAGYSVPARVVRQQV